MTGTHYPSSWNGSSWVSGPNLGNTFDGMGRLQKLTDLTASSDIIANATYAPTGQLLTMTGASGAPNETRTYNSIGQMTRLQSGSLDIQYAYPATQNNGKISSQYDSVSGEQITYMYDSLNRLASATGYGWGQSYNYDGFGNLTDQNVTSGTAPALHVSYDPASNRQTGECADANGNLNVASGYGCQTGYTYDVENRIIRKGNTNAANPDVAYSYAPGNKRVWRGAWDGSGTQTVDELTFWSVNGQKLATYQVSQYQPWPGDIYTMPQLVATQTGTNYYFGGKLVKNSTGYVTPDRLGSIGKYFPYGQERPSASADGKEKFATYFRDSETGLDYANNRYHQVGMGRFMTPDSTTGKAADPSSWNKYAYVEGDPIGRIDPTGRSFCAIDFLEDGVVPLIDYPCDPGDIYDVGIFGQIWVAIMTASSTGNWGPVCSGNQFLGIGGTQCEVPGPGSGLSQNQPQCPLVAPTGNYTVAPGVVALFAPDMAVKIDAAFAVLNQEGIVPMITGGFRTAAGQAAVQNSPFGAAQVSQHQIGEAIDINHNVSASTWQAIEAAMTGQGLTWGGTFRRKDPVHYQNAPAGTIPDPNQVAACAAEHP